MLMHFGMMSKGKEKHSENKKAIIIMLTNTSFTSYNLCSERRIESLEQAEFIQSVPAGPLWKELSYTVEMDCNQTIKLDNKAHYRGWHCLF